MQGHGPVGHNAQPRAMRRDPLASHMLKEVPPKPWHWTSKRKTKHTEGVGIRLERWVGRAAHPDPSLAVLVRRPQKALRAVPSSGFDPVSLQNICRRVRREQSILVFSSGADEGPELYARTTCGTEYNSDYHWYLLWSKRTIQVLHQLQDEKTRSTVPFACILLLLGTGSKLARSCQDNTPSAWH